PLGWLMLPQWLDPEGQHQPGAMSANDVRILLRGEECPNAWHLSPTGISPAGLTCDTLAAGGTEVRLERFEQAAAIVLTQDPAVIEELRRETQLTRALAGPAYVAIARARLERVQAVHDELLSLAPRTDLQ